MNVSFEGIGKAVATFAGEQCAVGAVCKVAGNGIVSACQEGERFCGIVDSVRGDRAAVQLEGFASVKYSGDLAAGFVSICADGNGGVKAGQGREHLVVCVNSAAKTAVIKL